ncbi:MAG: restriction endonuclease subunit S [Marmoricola sp.]
MSSWETKPLGERTLNLDRRRVPIKSSDRKAGPYPYYGASGVVDHVGDYIFEGLHLLVAEDGENLRSRKSPIAFLADGKYWVNNHAHVLQGNSDNDTRFLSYVLEATDIGGYLTGSTQPKLTQKSLASVPIYAPGIAEQVEIADLLGTLDDQVASNTRAADICLDLLDVLAARFAFEAPPVPLGTVASVARAQVNPASYGPSTVDHYSLPAFDVDARPVSEPGSSIMSNKFLLETPAILVSRLNPRTNRTWWAEPRDGVPALASTEFSCLTASDRASLAGLWLAVRSPKFVAELVRRVTGTSGSHQRVRPDDLLAIQVPDCTALESAVLKQALSLVDAVQSARDESAEVRRLRDALIPEMLSGRVKVSDLAARGKGEAA